MPLIDVRNLPQVTQIQAAFDAVLDRANMSVAGWRQQLAQKVAEFFATPNRIAALNTRIAFTAEKARARNNMDALGKLSGIKSFVAGIGTKYEKAKPVVQATLSKAQAAGLGMSVAAPGWDLAGAAVNAGVLMSDVFSALKAQEVAIAAVEKGVLTPAEAAELYKRLQSPNATRNVALMVGGAVLVWFLLRRR